MMSEFPIRTCPLCDFTVKGVKSLQKHILSIHSIEPEQLYVDMFLGGKRPECKCGCGKIPLWASWIDGFRKYILGHNGKLSSLDENEAKTIRDKRLETFQKHLADGTVSNWSKGLTKDTDERLARAAKIRSKTMTSRFASGEIKVWSKGLTKETDIRLAEQSARQKQGFADGTYVPWMQGLTKETSPSLARMSEKVSAAIRENKRVKRLARYAALGLSITEARARLVAKLPTLCYRDSRLFKLWKSPILDRDNHRCTKCGKQQNLHVHHDKELMITIMMNIVGDRDMSNMDENELFDIVDGVVAYHIDNQVSGITLCRECHSSEHGGLVRIRKRQKKTITIRP